MMKHKFHSLTAALLAGCLLIGSATAVSFPDVDADAPYAEAVDYVSDAGIMAGDDEGNFNPDQVDTRGKMAAIISQAMDLDVDSAAIAPFSDTASHWAGPCIAAIAELGVVKGYGNGCYGPSDDVTCEQTVAMIVRMKGWEAEAVSRGGWPSGYLAVAQDHGLLDGVSSTPGAPFTRAQVAQVIYNARTEENYDEDIFSDTEWTLRTYTGTFTVRFYAYGSCTIQSELMGTSETAQWQYHNGILSFDSVDYIADGDGRFISVDTFDGGSTGIDSFVLTLKSKESTSTQNQPETISLSDGEYTITLSRDNLGRNKNGDLTAVVDILESVIFTNQYVQSLKIGDVIDVDFDQIKVETLDNYSDDFGTRIRISDAYVLFKLNDGTWELRTGEETYRFYRTVGTASITFASNVKVTDEWTGDYFGDPSKSAQTVEEFFDKYDLSSYRTYITVTGGRVTEVYFPYTPVAW